MTLTRLSPKRVVGTIAALALFTGIFSAPAQAGSPTRPAVHSASSSTTPFEQPATTGHDPAIASDGFITFTFESGSATSVSVSGSWGLSYTNVAYPMSKSGSTWTVFLGPLTPGLYSYNFIVDGTPTKDPDNSSVVNSNAALSTFFVPGRSADFETVHRGAKGSLTLLTYHSAVTNSDRKATVWTPPGYAQSRRANYPTFYLVHGGGGGYLDWVQQGRADVILNNLYDAGKLKPMVVVMVDGNIPGSTGLPEDDQFIPEVLDNLLPAVQKNYRVSPAASQRALAGLSLGGLQTFNMFIVKPGAFNYVGDFSSGYFPSVIDQLKTHDAAALSNKAINKKTALFRIYIGNRADIAYTNNIATRALFDQFHIRYQFAGSYPVAGHVWKTWQHDLDDFAPRLFK